MKTIIKRIPWFYILFTIYPLLFLWATNITEIDPSVVIRPFLVTLLGSAILYAILYISFRNIDRAALIGTLILIIFFSYGHLYYKTRTVPALEILSHHHTLIPIYLVLFALGVWGIFRLKKYTGTARFMNVVGLVLVGLQVFQLGYSYTRAAFAARRPVTLQSGLTVPANRSTLPDVYFIVLDTYMRSDALQQEMGFDNTPFLKQLDKLGFYVAHCSRPNYAYTKGSIASILNMNFLPDLEATTHLSTNDDGFWTVINHNEVARQLKSIGYKTIAFQNEYPRLEVTDADVFLGLGRPSINSHYLYPFEDLYLRSTAAVIFTAADSKLNISRLFQALSPSQDPNANIPANLDPFLRYHIDLQYFTLEKLTEIPAIPGPKFVYAHIMIPHGPYVFGPNGEIVADPNYIGDDSASAADSAEARQGYVYGVQFIDGKIIPVLQDIISKSKNPPIIILQGDHGYRDKSQGKYTILNAYYLPGGYSNLYPSITPVNSFRMILDDYFGANYPLLPDITSGDVPVVPETYSDCLP